MGISTLTMSSPSRESSTSSNKSATPQDSDALDPCTLDDPSVEEIQILQHTQSTDSLGQNTEYAVMCTVLVWNTGYQQSDTVQSLDVQTSLHISPEINRQDISTDCWSYDTL